MPERGGKLDRDLSPTVHEHHRPTSYKHQNTNVARRCPNVNKQQLHWQRRQEREGEKTHLERNRCSNSGPARPASWRLFLSFFRRFLAETSTWYACNRQGSSQKNIRRQTCQTAHKLERKRRYVDNKQRARLARCGSNLARCDEPRNPDVSSLRKHPLVHCRDTTVRLHSPRPRAGTYLH